MNKKCVAVFVIGKVKRLKNATMRSRGGSLVRNKMNQRDKLVCGLVCLSATTTEHVILGSIPKSDKV